MKNLFLILIVLLLAIFSSCKKEEGVSGKKVLKGSITFANGVTGSNDPAAGAKISIAYGVTAPASSYDQTIVTDAGGNYRIQGLRTGDYFITAEFTDGNGFRYTTPGYHVSIKNKKNELTLDILLH